MKISIFVGGQYSSAPIRHRSSNRETHKDFFRRLGFQISTNPNESDIFLAIDHSGRDEEILLDRKSQRRHNFLYRGEPICVMPDSYDPYVEALYDGILTFGMPDTTPEGSLWPQFWPDEFGHLNSLQPRKEKFAFVNGNKLSLNSSELYTLRRHCLKKLTPIDLFGTDWNTFPLLRVTTLLREIRKDPLKNFLRLRKHSKWWFAKWPFAASPESKLQLLSEYKYNLVIENDLSYMSEKLFDSLFAGCIPVYVGPDISQYGLPSNLVIQADPNIKSIDDAMKFATTIDHSKFLATLKDCLGDPKIKNKFSGDQVLERAAKIVEESYLLFNKHQEL